MLYVAYNPSTETFFAARNNPATGYAQKKEFDGSMLQYVYHGDGAIDALLALAKEVPHVYHEVDNTPRVKARRQWGRIVQ